MALRRLATVLARSDWPSRLTRNCRACQFGVFGAARLRLLIPENSIHGPAARSRAPLGQDLNLLLQPTVRRSAETHATGKQDVPRIRPEWQPATTSLPPTTSHLWLRINESAP